MLNAYQMMALDLDQINIFMQISGIFVYFEIPNIKGGHFSLPYSIWGCMLPTFFVYFCISYIRHSFFFILNLKY